ncbi:MAG: ABC transporter permease DevC [Elioraea sp.]|nr:ABC transporter permease DevC [Elioraea sp.]
MNKLAPLARAAPAPAPASPAPPPTIRPPRAAGLRLPFRLAWRQLRHEPARLAAALSGVVFATLLIFMQIGFMNALFDSAVLVQNALRADLFLVHRTTEALWRSASFPRARLAQALALPEVERVVPLYVANVPWKNPETGLNRTLLLFGVDPTARLLGFHGLDDAAWSAITRPDTILFDARGKPEFGPIASLLAQGPFFGELNRKRVEVVGTFGLGATFSSESNAIASEPTFWRLVPGRTPAQVDVGAVVLKPGADIVAAQRALATLLPDDVRVFTRAELAQFERDYWANVAPIGFIFGLGVAIGLVVGCVIVYQILFSDISRHLGEYATLKAMGYTDGYLARVVMSAAIILAVLGFLPGLVLSFGLYEIASAQIFIPLHMTLPRASFVFGLIFAMCVVSGLIAIRKLRDADPADMFR